MFTILGKMAAIFNLAAILDSRKCIKRCFRWILTNISNNDPYKNMTVFSFWANAARKGLNMAAILKFKMAAEDTLEKSGNNSGLFTTV